MFLSVLGGGWLLGRPTSSLFYCVGEGLGGKSHNRKPKFLIVLGNGWLPGRPTSSLFYCVGEGLGGKSHNRKPKFLIVLGNGWLPGRPTSLLGLASSAFPNTIENQSFLLCWVVAGSLGGQPACLDLPPRHPPTQ